ncbi:S8 family serine peptidase [Endozoicomonas arenosclerae]|uniref:S8 family serine peptidase n=1 Tax=Endozoicomonas arenosclerae TaxID=1633495 RepID=UPI000782A49C|nr:S8 family serine peptidase [Endozoicomonas arenosclerae]
MKTRIMKPLAVGVMALTLAGCKVELSVDGNNHWVTDPVSIGLPHLPPSLQTVSFEGTIEQKGNSYVFSHGVLYDIGGGRYSYISTTGEDAEIPFTISHGKISRHGTLTVSNVSTDPLFGQQWHLSNTGQSAYSQNQDGMDAYIEWSKAYFGYDDDYIASNPQRYTFNADLRVADQDMNAGTAHAMGYTGKGVVVAVTDTGLEGAHEDLVDNYRVEGSFNFVEADSDDPTNIYDSRGDHGTSVGGLIAASAGNGLGGRGVAPEATLLGQNFLKNQTDEATATIHGMYEGADQDVINKSWGSTLFVQTNGVIHNAEVDGYIDAYPALNLRDGKGAVVVKSAGNSFDDSDLSQRHFGLGLGLCDVNGANDNKLTCSNASINSGNNHPYQMVIGSNNADGTHTSYSTAGSAVWASAPSGEFGFREPAMITTDQSNCEIGYSGSVNENFYLNAYQGYPYGKMYPLNGVSSEISTELDPGCNYVQTFNGTSSAAPNTSGATALILEANSNLSWRDVKRIIASTADQIVPEDPQVILPVGESEYVAHDGWMTNAAGYSFNNLFGFGRVNVGEAVKMAETYDDYLGTYTSSGWIDTKAGITVPDNDAKGVTHSIEIDDKRGVVEEVQIRITLSNDSVITDVQKEGPKTASTIGSDTAFELTSPSGTKSIMLTARTGTFASYDWVFGVAPADETLMYKDMMLLSNAFYGEPAGGTWTLRVIDTNGKDIPSLNPEVTFVNNTVDSTLDTWGITFYGENFANELVGEK